MNEDNKFKFYKYFSNKFLLPLVGLLVWAVLLYVDKIKGIEEMGVSAIILLSFAGLFSVHDGLKAYLKARYGKDDEDEQVQ